MDHVEHALNAEREHLMTQLLQCGDNIVLCPPDQQGGERPAATQSSGDGDSSAWIIFDSVWALALLFLAILFRWNRGKKLLVKIPDNEKKKGEDEKDKEPPEPTVT